MYCTLFVGVWLRGKGSKNGYNEDQDTSPHSLQAMTECKNKKIGCESRKSIQVK